MMRSKSPDLSIIRELVPIHHLDRDHKHRMFFWERYNHPANNIFMYWPTRNRQEFDDIFESAT